VEKVLPVVRQRIAETRLALQGVLDALPALALPLGEGEAEKLSDWDEPADLPPGTMVT
jgi:hypothetical protein